MPDTVDPTLPSRTVAGGLLGPVLVVALGAAQLSWVGRSDRVDDMFVSFIGPCIGIGLGLWFRIRFDRDRRLRLHSRGWHVAVAALVIVGWLLAVNALNGGVGTEALVPTIVLGVIGTAVMVAGTRIFNPEVVA